MKIREISMYRKNTSVVVLLMFLSYLFACASTRYLTKEELSQESEISAVHVTTKDGRQLKLDDPIIEGNILTQVYHFAL